MQKRKLNHFQSTDLFNNTTLHAVLSFLNLFHVKYFIFQNIADRLYCVKRLFVSRNLYIYFSEYFLIFIEKNYFI